ncbi:MAG: HD domain-containing protein [Chloroflexi bacterium]|nr:HD domain-containing protein [Chloroflexota bacterium]
MSRSTDTNEVKSVANDQSKPATQVIAAEGFDLPPAPGREQPSLPLVREVSINVPARHNPRLQAIIDRINQDDELYMLWRCANINAVDRLGMSDHGPVHAQIVANIALKLLRLLIGYGVQPSVVAQHDLTNEDAEVVVVLGALLHDIGMAIHRDDHEWFSLMLAPLKLRDLLTSFYDIAARTIVMTEALQAIISHRAGGRPLTLEAGIVRVADALDTTKGRSRIAFEAGKINIHSLSAAAIDRVEIEEGDLKPIRIAVVMLNSSGIFQLDELLKEKLHGSGLEPYVEVVATVQGETEKKLVEVFRV